MRLDQELVLRKLSESRTEAQELISGGFVIVNGVVSIKQTKQITGSDSLEVTRRREFVSRGGDKLKGALSHVYGDDVSIGQFCSNKKVLDIGSSTGGFTDCVLRFGAANVDAVDVGTSQLHPKIKGDARVTSFENTDIRNFKPNTHYDLVVADLSFIPLEHVFDTVISFGVKDTVFLLLIKPQFEVGKGNTKKGIVKEDSLVYDILSKYNELSAQKGLTNIDIFKCSIQGGDGNQEYFLYGILG